MRLGTLSDLMTTIQLSVLNGIATLSLTPPVGKPPTLDGGVLKQFLEKLDQLEANIPRALIVTSASEKYFCVGANLQVLKKTDSETIGPWVRHGHEVLNRLEQIPCPTIARVTGYAMGGGLELAMACDLIFAHETASLGQSEAGLGFIPGWGGCRRLADRIGKATAKRLFYTSRILGAREAHDIGLVDEVGPADEINQAIGECTDAICRNSAHALASFKKIINESPAEQSSRDYNLEIEALESVACVQNPDTAQRLEAFFNRKKS